MFQTTIYKAEQPRKPALKRAATVKKHDGIRLVNPVTNTYEFGPETMTTGGVTPEMMKHLAVCFAKSKQTKHFSPIQHKAEAIWARMQEGRTARQIEAEYKALEGYSLRTIYEYFTPLLSFLPSNHPLRCATKPVAHAKRSRSKT